MEMVHLTHPEGRQGISMDKRKYNNLSTAVLDCLTGQQPKDFSAIFAAVTQYLKKHKQPVQGKLEWNLRWVMLDLEAKQRLLKNNAVSPILYAIAKKGPA